MADEKYWSYQSSTRTPVFEELPNGVFNGTERQWHSLSPGMRREIVRSANRRRLRRTNDLFGHT